MLPSRSGAFTRSARASRVDTQRALTALLPLRDHPPFPMPTEASPVPPDDLRRQLTIARPDTDPNLPHFNLVGDTYTVLLNGQDTAGRYCLIDMFVPPGGGPPPHRHDFEEMFSVLEGEVEVTFRGITATLRAGETANVPANAPHQFRNVSDRPARMLCLCAPAGQEEFFASIGVPVASRTAPSPAPSGAPPPDFKNKVEALAAKYRTEML